MIHKTRIHTLRDTPPDPNQPHVVYWMQQSQRESCNHALEHAIDRANALGKPLYVLFGVTDNYPEASERHYAFMLQGLCDTGAALAKRGIRLIVRHQPPDEAAIDASHTAALLVTDRGYLRIQKLWRDRVAKHARCRVEQVEADVVVPVDEVTDKEEFAARTIRPKITRLLRHYLTPLKRRKLEHPSIGLALDESRLLDITDPSAALARLKIDRRIGTVNTFKGGYAEADRLLKLFEKQKLQDYADLRNDPDKDKVSHMSPYLHFGQVSPLEIVLRVQSAGQMTPQNTEAYIEELIVRRELSMNFVHHNADYDRYACLPAWARQTLDEHRADTRPYIYDYTQLETGQTHDRYWNAAQMEMVLTGKMHNYMRMYWGKKILEWSATPEDAFDTALRLNNAYQLDGRDANSFTGVAWCFGKHDRPWTQRPIFGTVRYMNDKGLERKFDIDSYVMKVGFLGR